MGKTKAILRSMRIRTLPLSVSGVLLGSMLALADYHIRLMSIILVVLTAAALQVLSNLANELGDVQHGTDTAKRVGPLYSLNRGELTIGDMKKLVCLSVMVSIVCGLIMIRVSFGSIFSSEAVAIEILGALAIWAAIRYTVGRNPYGYRGFGDISVFVFYGIVAVLGSFYICAHTLPGWPMLLPASAIGFFCVGVLNVNNIRDIVTDAATRTTVAISLGPFRARIYQTLLIVLGWTAMVLYCLCRFPDPWHWLFLLTLPLFLWHIVGVWRLRDERIDRMLPQLVLSIFFFALLGGLGYIIFLF